MWRDRSIWLLVLIWLSVGSVVLSVDQDPEADSLPNRAYLDAQPQSETAEPPDICLPLYEAEKLLLQLQPRPNAHLERKISSSAVSLGSTGWGEELGWGHGGPLSTTLRLLPRVLSNFTPSSLLARFSFLRRLLHRPGPSSFAPDSRIRMTKARKQAIEDVLRLLREAESAGCSDASAVRAKMRMFPPKGIKQDLPEAFEAYKSHVQASSSPESQFMLGFFYSTGLGGVQEDQAKALLYFTFSALQGYAPAEMANGYRYWSDISVQERCTTALDYYESAAAKAYSTFLGGPPGGRTLPLTPTRLSDHVGGVYGPYASWSSAGINARRAAVRASLAAARGETEREVLEYLKYHSDRDSHMFTTKLGWLHYLGSVYFIRGGVGSGGEGVGEIARDFKRAKQYFLKSARVLWDKDFDAEGKALPKRKLSGDQELAVREPASIAASYLGRMNMRGEGGKPDYKRARLWYERAAEMGDSEAQNGLGILYRDGLGVAMDRGNAFQLFQAAAGQDLAEAQVNLAKLYLERGEQQQAQILLDAALRHGSPFEAFHLLSSIHARSVRSPAAQGGRPGMCGVSVGWYKLVAEKGNWDWDFMGEADRAWGRGEVDKAVLGWWIAAEMGVEGGMESVAFALEKGFGRDLLKGGKVGSEREVQERAKAMGLRYWIRSAAQDNVDSMVKVGDLFYDRASVATLSPSNETNLERAASYYRTAADTQLSAMAYWNLGYMHEHGKGVPRDWYLAKRYYDLSGEVSTDGWGAVMLSLIGLYIRSWWTDLRTSGAVPGLSLFTAPEDGVAPPQPDNSWTQMIKSIFAPAVPLYEEDLQYAGGGPGGTDDPLPDGWEDYSGAGAGGGAEGADALEDTVETVLILSLGLGLMGLFWVRGRWAEQERQREEERRRHEHGQQGGGQAHPGDQPAAAGAIPAPPPAAAAAGIERRPEEPIPPYII